VRAAQRARETFMSNPNKILIVGDDPAERERFEKEVSGKGHTVTTVASGEDALWQASNDRYDAIITSVKLRGISGLEVAEEIQAGRLRVPVIIIADAGAEGALKQAAAAGVAAEILRRPLPPGLLAETTDRVLRSAKPDAAPQPQAAGASQQTMIRFALRLRDIVLFLLAPVIGLVYLLTLPIIGLGLLTWFAFKSRGPAPEKAAPPQQAMAGPGILKTVGMILAVGISGVAYAVITPILGIGLILWAGFQAWGRLGARAMRA
jgi:CheY-like chemotaxis protein